MRRFTLLSCLSMLIALASSGCSSAATPTRTGTNNFTGDGDGDGDTSAAPGDGDTSREPGDGDSSSDHDAGTGTDCSSGSADKEGCSCSKAGAIYACYPGDPDTRDIGVCKDGMQTCKDSGGEFGLIYGKC